MAGLLSSLLGRARSPDPEPASAPMLHFDEWPSVVYAIGDVHGRLDLLQALERKIVADAEPFGGERWMVLVGDCIDRGPSSAQVLDHLSEAAPAGFTRHLVAGNHERMMQRLFAGGWDYDWLRQGGAETLESYGVPAAMIDDLARGRGRALAMARSYVPDEHLAFLRSFRCGISLPGWSFVHLPPYGSSPDHHASDRRMARELGLEVEVPAAGGRVVHGHRIVAAVNLEGAAVNVDTGAYLTGRLSALRLAGPDDLAVLQVTGSDLVPDANEGWKP